MSNRAKIIRWREWAYGDADIVADGLLNEMTDSQFLAHSINVQSIRVASLTVELQDVLLAESLEVHELKQTIKNHDNIFKAPE